MTPYLHADIPMLDRIQDIVGNRLQIIQALAMEADDKGADKELMNDILLQVADMQRLLVEQVYDRWAER